MTLSGRCKFFVMFWQPAVKPLLDLSSERSASDCRRLMYGAADHDHEVPDFVPGVGVAVCLDDLVY